MHHTCASAQSLSGMDGNGPHSVRNTRSLVGGTVEGFRGGLVRGSVGLALKFQKRLLSPPLYTLFSVCEVSAAVPALCLLACHHAPATMVINSVSLELPAPNKLSQA